MREAFDTDILYIPHRNLYCDAKLLSMPECPMVVFASRVFPKAHQYHMQNSSNETDPNLSWKRLQNQRIFAYRINSIDSVEKEC